MPMLGRAIGPYQVLERLGSGGMGDVFLAEDRRLHRRVALKQIRDVPGSAEPRSALLREARAAAALNHPNIAAIYDIIEDDDTVCIVLEYVEGKLLSSRLRNGPLPVDEAAAIGTQILDALGAAHAAGILHCDLKPANIICTPSGRAKVLDFGLAQRLISATADTIALSLDAAQSSVPTRFSGTVGYMAPERLTGGTADVRSDIYSAGVVLFEMLTGRRPFEGNDIFGVAMAALTQTVPSPSTLNPSVPERLSSIVLRAMARNPKERFDSAAAFRDELAQANSSPSSGTAVTSSSRPSRRRSAFKSPLVAVVALLAVLSAAWTYTRIAKSSAPPAVSAHSLAGVAVRTFSTLGGKSADHLGVGIADDLTARLAALSSIAVVSRSSTANYLAQHPDSRTLARDLGVAYVVEGTVQTSGDRLHVGVTLTRPDGSVAWGTTYEGITGDLFSMQRQIAEAVAAALTERVDATISESDHQHLDTPPTRNVDAFADYSQGRMFLEKQDSKDGVDRAIEAFERATAKDARFASAYAGLGAACWAKYKLTNDPAWTARAIDATLEAQRLDPHAAGVHVALGEIYGGMGRTDSAIAELRRALQLHPNEPDAHRLLGIELEHKGLIDQAIAEYRKGIALLPDYFRNYNSMGVTLMHAGRFREAAEAFTRVTELQPDSASGFNNLGVVFIEMGDLPNALAKLTRGQQLDPNDYACVSNIATIQYWMGRFAEARRTYLRALQLQPADATMHRNLADTLERLGDIHGARAEYRRSLELVNSQLKVNPRDTDALSLAALVEAKLGQHAVAREHADRALALSPTSSDVLFFNAAVYALTGDSDHALAQLKQALKAGYSPALARYDDSLASLRSLPEYQALLGSDGTKEQK